jgi:saccharopine dehydrogenase-like NADP-dependent oxidoreductase
MNILIAGANGTTGRQIIEELSKNRQMNVYGMIRKDEQAQTIKELGGHPILADLEGNVDKAVDNMEAIIFAADPEPKQGRIKRQLWIRMEPLNWLMPPKRKGSNVLSC